MVQKTLTTSYLLKLSTANHDGVTQQISDRLNDYTTDNAMLLAAIQSVGQARIAEDTAYKRFSGKDFASDDLKREDTLGDNYMSTTRGILNGLLYLPMTEPMRRKAELALQLFKDFQFSTSDGYEAEARKILNMNQQWQAATDYTLAELGIAEWVQKAVAQANKVLQLVTVRVEHESAKVKGELAEARKQTDAAIRQAYDILNALTVLQSSAELQALISLLLGIEERAKLYYINGATTAGGSGSGSSSSGSSSGGSEGGSSSSGGSSGGSEGGSSSSGSSSGGSEGGSSSSGSSSGGSEGGSSSSGSSSGGSEGGSTGGDSGGYDPDNGME